MSRVGDYQQQKKLLPYSIKNIDHTNEIKAWYAAREEGSKIRAAARREAAINMLMTDVEIPLSHTGLESAATTEYRTHQRQVQAKTIWRAAYEKNSVYTAKPSILSRIYNWFLDIKF